ncbi:protein argonaute PNH1-like [Miscanthus floridulus]|uniref:protein argonaute PNH1-like n=1 Tax=Miscanthus floridulus TaxID=154761 RepID=UPI00345A8E83
MAVLEAAHGRRRRKGPHAGGGGGGAKDSIVASCSLMLCVTTPSKPSDPKPSKQTQILLDQMSKSADDDQSKWDQQEMKTQIELNNAKVDKCSADQQFIAQQVRANGQAVAQLTLRQFEEEKSSASHGSSSLVYDDEEEHFLNMFAKDKNLQKPEQSNVPERLWVSSTTMHLEGNAAKWYQAYKQTHPKISWITFCLAMEQQFGADDYRNALTELIDLKQTGTVEDYTTKFEQLQFDITMHSCHYDDLFFTSHYVSGLKDDIRAVVEPQVPTTIHRAAIIARIQQNVLDRGKNKYQKAPILHKPNPQHRTETKTQPVSGTLWRDRQLRDYRKVNGLCYTCGEKFEPGHIEVCSKRTKPHNNALVVNDLDRELSDDVLNQLAIEDALPEQFCQLSLNALTSTDTSNNIKLKTRVKNKFMLTLLDSGSSHSFVSAQFTQLAGLPTVPMSPRKVKLANGEWIVADRMRHSPMQCDWHLKTLAFEVNGRPVKLQAQALRGVRIEVTHRGEACQKYKIASLTTSPPSLQFFESSAGVQKSVADYFREAYKLEMHYDFLPCLQVGSDQRPNYLPMEVCKIVSGHQYWKKLDSQQVSKLMDSTCQRPSNRENNIRQVVEHNDYNRTERASEFGMEVDYRPTSVQARVLPAPTLKYRGTGSESLCCPKDGQWNMIKKQVVHGARVGNWACVNFCYELPRDVANIETYPIKFCSDLVKWSCTTGVDMDNLRLPIYLVRPEQVENDLHRLCQDAENKLRVQKIDLLLAILPEKNGNLYGNFKRICETEIGIMSQCCLDKNVRSAGPPYFANVAIKINAKFGGRNLEFANPKESLPVVSIEPTIIFGADVTHPAALDDTAPSIASVVASQDWPKVANYNGIARAQGHRKELIDGLEDIVKELLLAFEERSKQRPKQLIFYRDGVSEGQFKQVLEQEIPEIEKAWKARYNEKPKITFIVVQKRHHTRLFPNDRQWIDRSGNILPGTVVDKNICHPTEFDFFLCSHAGIKGTSRPTHYHVLRDDNKFTADALQSLTYNLCYLYSSCQSVPPPAYYAHKLAFRARFYVNQGSSDVATSVGSFGSSAPAAAAAGPNPLPEIKGELKRLMFYC